MKRKIYIFLTVVLGILLSFIAHAAIEKIFIISTIQNGNVPEAYSFFGGTCFLPSLLSYSLLILGIIVGYFLGVWWWRVIYIEKRRMRSFCWKKAR